MQNQSGEFRDVIEKAKREGFVRVRVDGEIVELGRPEPIRLKKTERHTIEAVVDRLVIREGIRARLADSVETALKWGGQPDGGSATGTRKKSSGKLGVKVRYTTDYGNAESELHAWRTDAETFLFQQPPRRMPGLSRLGTQLVCDPDLMISDRTKTLAEGAITPWRRGTKRMQAYYRQSAGALVKHFHVDEDMPFAELPEQFKQALYFGTGDQPIEMSFGGEWRTAKSSAPVRRTCPANAAAL